VRARPARLMNIASSFFSAVLLKEHFTSYLG
jgi:hypothetical protein